MSAQITFTLDLESHWPEGESRYRPVTEKILEFLAERRIKATIFTVGMLAEEAPDLVKAVHEAGHEIACHSYDHTVLTQQTPDKFRDHTKKCKDILEDITGAKVIGYRAPVFSLTRESLWAVDILKELGFEYSSSILPAKNPLHGFSGVPNTPFKWGNGLLEIPAPVGTVGSFLMPYLGGFYLRYLPLVIIKRQIEKADENSNFWTYCHPYDFDGAEKNWRIKGASVPVSLLLWFNRKNTFKKMERLFSCYSALPPFKEQDFSGVTKVVDSTTL